MFYVSNDTHLALFFSTLMRKLGNASNELGKYFLHVKVLYHKSYLWFEGGSKVFAAIEGFLNIACQNNTSLNANSSEL